MKKKEESEKRERKKEVVLRPLLCNPPNFNSDFGGAKVRNSKILPVDAVQYFRVCST